MAWTGFVTLVLLEESQLGSPLIVGPFALCVKDGLNGHSYFGARVFA